MPNPVTNRRLLFNAVNATVVIPIDTTLLLLWLKADSFSLSDGTAVGGAGVTWTDQSINGRNGTQATAGARPLFKTNIFGTKPAIRFDGVDDFLQFTTDLPIGIFAPGVANSFTILVVGKSLNDTDSYIMGSSPSPYQIRVNRAGEKISMVGDDGDAISSVFGTALTNLKMSVWQRDSSVGDVSQFRENKTSRGTVGSTSGSYPLNRIAQTAGAGFANWDVGEIIVWGRFLSSAELDALYDAYLQPKWGLP